jgi:hypothetical protein
MYPPLRLWRQLMMRTFLAAALMLALVPEATAQDRDYWMVGHAADEAGRYTMADYVDAASITSPTGTTRRAWTWSFYAPFSERYPGEHGISLREFNCESRQYRWLESAHYAASGEVMPSGGKTSHWEWVIPNSMAEIELDFVCSAPEAWRSRAIRVNDGMMPADHAAAVFVSTSRN